MLKSRPLYQRPAFLASAGFALLFLFWLLPPPPPPPPPFEEWARVCAHAPPPLSSPLLVRGSGGGGAPALAAGESRGDSPAATFSRIYGSALWGADGGGSGFGSTRAATATLRAQLEMLVHRHRVVRLLDAPCGSAHWWPPLLARIRATVPCFEYVGVDVVASVVAANAGRMGDPRTAFGAVDLSARPAAGAALASLGRFDLALCRDALQHLPLELAVNALEALAAAAPRLVALGSYIEHGGDNEDIATGEYYQINVLKEPFNLDPARVVDALDEASPRKTERKWLLVFEGAYLQALDFGAMRERAGRMRAAGTTKRASPPPATGAAGRAPGRAQRAPAPRG
jgi:hypothetical protein